MMPPHIVERLVAGLFGADHRRFGGPGEVDPLVGSLPDVLALHQRVRLLVEHGGTHLTDDTDPMGMDPTRPHRRRPADYVFVSATIVAGVLLLVWVFFGSA